MSTTSSTAPQSIPILIIDDEPGLRDFLSQELSREGYQVMTAAGGRQAFHLLKEHRFHLAVCDLNMPDMGGLQVLDGLRKTDAEMEVIMMTGYGTIEIAVSAMKKGAYDFIQKPFGLEEFLALVEKSIEKKGMRSLIQELREAKKKLEETQIQLIQSEKLAGIGQLAAGVAHELNNPLSAVMGFSQLLLEDKTLTTLQKKDVETIYIQSQRCRTIIQNLLQFSRREEPRMEALDLIPSLQAVINLVKYDFSTSGIELIQEVPHSLPMIFGDSNQLQQVFLNLITNARQAMEGRSKSSLVITVERKEDDLCIRFKDNGPGISPKIQGKIFDPFFTTKSAGKGTGLGLSICHGIVEQHHGRLYIENSSDAGTTFVLELPVYE